MTRADIPNLPEDMCFARYGVELRRLTEHDIEMVRRWRTLPEISQFMVYRDEITPEMQRRWFASLHPTNDLHFIVHVDGVPCGLSDIKSIDWDAKTFVGGIFLTPDRWNSDVALRVALCASDFGFVDLGLDASLCTVVKANRRAVRFNTSLGYRILNDAEKDAEVLEMRLEKADYMHATRRLREYLTKVTTERPAAAEDTLTEP